MKLPTSFRTKKQRIKFAREFLCLGDMSDEEIIANYNIFPSKEKTKEEIIFDKLKIYDWVHLFWLEKVFNTMYPNIDTVDYFNNLKEKWYVATKNYLKR